MLGCLPRLSFQYESNFIFQNPDPKPQLCIKLGPCLFESLFQILKRRKAIITFRFNIEEKHLLGVQERSPSKL